MKNFHPTLNFNNSLTRDLKYLSGGPFFHKATPVLISFPTIKMIIICFGRNPNKRNKTVSLFDCEFAN